MWNVECGAFRKAKLIPHLEINEESTLSSFPALPLITGRGLFKSDIHRNV